MFEYNIVMNDFNELAYTPSDQQKRFQYLKNLNGHFEDICKAAVMLAFYCCRVFTNIIIGIVAKDDVNVHEYESVGRNVVHRILAQHIFSFTFKRMDKAKTLSSSSAGMVAPGESIDPGLIFQRSLLVSRTGQLDLQELIRCELSAYPTSLLLDNHILRKVDKPQLAHASD